MLATPSTGRPATSSTYDDGALRDGAGAWELEATVAAAWQGAGLDPAAIEKSRQAVVARGRTQL